MRPAHPPSADHRPDPFVRYISGIVSGLVACAVVAATLHADVAAMTMLVAVTIVMLATALRLLRRDDL
jgi:ammonia channel protein AmtB